jgi:tRNA-dihydrouridine synthase
MIGRGAVANPFLCDSIKGKKWRTSEKTKTFKAFHDTLYTRYAQKLCGPSHLLNRMKGLWSYFVRSFEEGDVVRKRINKVQKVDRYEHLVNEFFEAGPVWR